ncbi:MAG TPA: fructose 1,6-bisphosphatase, partial [Firmicutes bacterium]|nr:fructose 1,6-bisphosphatase [Bacillota bacterium]
TYNTWRLCNGKLVGPQDFFADPAYDRAKQIANEIADYMRSLGPFEPHRLGLEELEYTTLPHVMKKLSDRLVPIE